MKSQDLITVTHSGSATAGDVDLITLLMAYPALEGGSEKYIGAEELTGRCEELVTIEDTISPAGVSVYTGARALNAVTTTLKANRDYAVVGAFVGVACGSLTIRGQDTANLRASIPGNALMPNSTLGFFADLSSWTGLECIPVINAANQANTFIEITQDENGGIVPFSLQLALLAEK